VRRRFSYPNGNSDVHRNTDADTHGYVYRDSDSDCYFDSHGNTDANSNPEANANAQISAHAEGSSHSSTAALKMKERVVDS